MVGPRWFSWKLSVKQKTVGENMWLWTGALNTYLDGSWLTSESTGRSFLGEGKGRRLFLGDHVGRNRMYFVRADFCNVNSILLVYRYLQIYFTYHIYLCIDLSILNTLWLYICTIFLNLIHSTDLFAFFSGSWRWIRASLERSTSGHKLN